MFILSAGGGLENWRKKAKKSVFLLHIDIRLAYYYK
jgi:hypothetical protein